ncbi:hypothetical protein CRG98_011615 [Punica granatum]|uniref:Uncharacterized protein n=1 Tax=Punica granatum TaxID=22663 RepID=A0A2I0KHT1_PUNGR|nr:hypothetical protein CRG98_011615 [Punica granatum]
MVGVGLVPWMSKARWTGSQSVTTSRKFRTMLPRVGAPRIKGINFLKSDGILFKTNEIEPEPSKYPQWSRQALRTPILSHRGRIHALSHVLGASTFPWGRVTDTHENESPLTVYDPKVEGR